MDEKMEAYGVPRFAPKSQNLHQMLAATTVHPDDRAPSASWKPSNYYYEPEVRRWRAPTVRRRAIVGSVGDLPRPTRRQRWLPRNVYAEKVGEPL
jgi:hypothetical protein